MSLTVLAVDDSRTIRDMLKLTLTEAGITLHLAEDGMHGLEVLEGDRPPMQLSLTSICRASMGSALWRLCAGSTSIGRRRSLFSPPNPRPNSRRAPCRRGDGLDRQTVRSGQARQSAAYGCGLRSTADGTGSDGRNPRLVLR